LAFHSEYSEVAERLSLLLSYDAVKASTSMPELGQAVEALMRLKGIRDWFHSFELQQQLSSLVHEVWSSAQTDADRRVLLDQKLSRLVSSLRSKIGAWRVVVPLANLTIPNRRKLRVGKVDLFRFSKNRHRRTLEQVRATLTRNPHYANKHDFINKYVDQIDKAEVGPLVERTCAETEVYGRDDDAFEEALPQIEEAIAVIKFFHFWNDDSYGRYFGIVGRTISQTRRVMLRYSKEFRLSGFESAWVGTLFEYEIDADRLKFMEKGGFSELNQILAKEDRTHVEERIISAILWFAKAVDVVLRDSVKVKRDPILGPEKRARRKPRVEMMGPNDRLVKLMVSLETLLLLDRNEPIGANLSERVAMLVRRDYDQRKAIRKFVRDMYDKRSDVVHHGGKGITEGELSQLTFLTQEVIVTLVKNYRRWKLASQDSIAEWFLRLKLGGH
jgi:hypothetical protein